MKTPTYTPLRHMRWVVMSMLAAITLVWGAGLRAHETQPAIANVVVTPDRFEMQIALNAEALLAGIDLSTYQDTNDAPEAEEYDRLRALPGESLASALATAWPDLALGFNVDGAGPLVLEAVDVTVPASAELSRESVLTIAGPMADTAEGVTVGWVRENGVLVVRQSRDGEVFAELLQDGASSQFLPATGVAEESAGEAFWRFLVAGFEHIIPLGIDHILFVLGLFFFALKWSPILWQVTAFTVAHTVTLALATLG
ncbi:MAG: HupE/UreJ family protein, partial [Pseudomonadota bacterium]